MPLYLFHTMVQKSQKWPKTQIKGGGGSCLKLTTGCTKREKRNRSCVCVYVCVCGCVCACVRARACVCVCVHISTHKSYSNSASKWICYKLSELFFLLFLKRALRAKNCDRWSDSHAVFYYITSNQCTWLTWKTHSWSIREVLQNEFRYNFRKGPREISAGTVFTVFTCIIAVNTVITVPAEISRGHFRKSYRNSFCKTSLQYCRVPKNVG